MGRPETSTPLRKLTRAKIKGMKTLLPLTPAELARAEDRLLRPKPGSRIEAARKYGIDLTLLVGQLRLTPAERAEKLELATTALEQVRGTARKRSV